MKMIYLIIVLMSLTFAKTQAIEMVTDRPDQTESSSTVPKGSLQIESGFLIETGTLGNKQVLMPSTLFRLGILNGFELRMSNQIEKQIPEKGDEITGISDMEIGFKVELFRSKQYSTEIAFLTHVLFPIGSDGLTNGVDYGSINKLAVSHVLSESTSIGYNLGYDYVGYGDGNATYSLVLGHGVTEKLGVYIEVYGEFEQIKKHYSKFDTGFTYLIVDNFQVDFSFGSGINHTMNYSSIGISWNINK